jgi:hypothetical protein
MGTSVDKSVSPSSPWQLKPWWCQPWSIVLTGTSLIAGSWLLLHRWWVTAIVALPILLWMSFFVLLWPRLMRAALAVEADSPEPPVTL